MHFIHLQYKTTELGWIYYLVTMFSISFFPPVAMPFCFHHHPATIFFLLDPIHQSFPVFLICFQLIYEINSLQDKNKQIKLWVSL